jgi:hypothetical protein
MPRLASLLVVVTILLVACSATTPALTAPQVVERLKSAGLEVESPTEMKKDDYGLAPFVCKGQRFLIPSLGADKGGRLFVCDSSSDRDALKAYYDALGKGSAAFFSWTFAKGSVLIQLNGSLPEDQAKKYEAAINALP